METKDIVEDLEEINELENSTINTKQEEQTNENIFKNNDGKHAKENININNKLIIAICIIVFCILALLGLLLVLLMKSNIKKAIPISLSSISINSDVLQVEIGETIEVKPIFEPRDYLSTNIQWISSNPEIISVDNGIIKGVSLGKANIYAIDGEIKSNELVFNCGINVSEINIKKDKLSINIGESTQLACSVLPKDATNKTLLFSSSDEKIATVDENGKITGITPGNCEITVTDCTKKIKTVCNVTINIIEIKNVSLDDKNVTLGVGQSYILVSSFTPNNASKKELEWKSSNENVVTIDNGNIKAIGEGTADVTITSHNKKTATCSFTVKSSNPDNPTKYIMNTSNIRSKSDKNSTSLVKLNRNDEIEILKTYNNWSKVRTSNGTLGFISKSDYSSSKTQYIYNVPYINQFSLGYPTGCEAVSATMAAKYSGYSVDSATIIANTPTDTNGKREEIVINENGEEETIWVGSNPFEVFVGHPTKGLSTGSYGCFANPLVIGLRNSGVSCTDISGCSPNTLFNYIDQGKPVVVWCKKGGGDLTDGVTWKYPDGSGEYLELVGEHCAVLIGYNDEYVYLNDPSAGQDVSQSRSKFTSNWVKLYSQAVVIN